MSSQISGKAQLRNQYGITVQRVASTLPASTDLTIFNVAGGRVLLTTLVGEVTTVIQAQATATKIRHTSTVGAITSDLCATVDLTGAVVGTQFGITGSAGTAAAIGSAVPQTNEVVLTTGALKLNTAATSTGAMRWTITYIPLDDGASITAA